MPPKTLTAEQVAEIDRQQQPQRSVNWQSVIPQKEDVLTARVNRAARQDAPATLTAEQVDTAEAQNSVAAETSFGRAMGARPDRSAGPLAPGPKKVLSAREVQQINHDRVSDISYLPTMDEWREDQKFKAERDDSVGRFVEAGKAIAGGLFQAAAATAYAPFDFVARGTKAYDEWVNSSAEGIRQASISTAELWSWAGDVVNDSVRETERVNVIDNQLRQRLAAENKFTGNAQADAQIFAQARERAMASGAYGKTQEQEADDENTQYQRFIRDRSFQQQAANITETNIGTLPDGRAEMGIDESKLNPGLVTTTALVADPLNIALPIGFGAVNKLRVLRRVASLTGTPLRGASKAAGAMAQGSENIYSKIVEGVENATGIGEAGQAAAVSAVSWKAAAAMATLKGSGRVLRNVERGLETGSILAREIGIGGVGVSRVEAAKKLRYAPIPERYRRAYDGFFTSPDSTLRRVSETPGLSPIARRSAATLDKLGATQVFRATDDALSGALATAPIAVPLAAIAPEERRPEILGALMTVGAGAGLVGGKVRRMSEFDDALVAKMLADADISGGDAASLANALPHDKLVNMARMQSVISAKADFIPLRAKDYALDTTVNEAMGLGTRGIHVDAQKGKRPRIYLNIDKIATGDVAGHEIGHAIFRSNILGGEIKQGMRGMVDVQYGMDGIAARGREYVNSQLTQEVRDGTTGIQLNVLTPDEVQRIAAAGGDEAAEQALKQEFIRERWAKDADWRKQAIDERTDMLNQERLAQGETAWDWARDEIAAETFSGLGKGLNLSGIRASGPLGRAVGAAQATMEAMGARFKGNGRLETPNQLFVENPLFDTPEMRKAVSNYVKTYDRYLVGLEKEGKIKQRGTPIAPTGRASDAARSPHTRTYANTKNGVTVVESDLFIERPDGTRVPKSQEMINTQEKARAATLKSINDRTKFAEREGDWGARKLSNGRVEVGGPTLPLQFDSFIQVPEWLRIKARDFEAGRAEGRSYLYSVNVIGSGESGTYKVKNLGNVEAKVGEMVPFGWAVSQKNHLLTKVIDLNSFRAATMRAIDNEQLGEFGNDLRAVEAGLKQMLRNYQDGNPGETGLGVTKKNILNGLLGTGTVTQRQNNPAWYTLNNQGSVRTFRFDRLNYADPYGTGYFPHYNKININALPDDAGRMSMDSYRQFDADRKVAWMNKEAAKRGYSNATNWQNADAQGFQAADAQYRQEFPTESMPQQIPREAQGMPDVAASGRGDGMPDGDYMAAVERGNENAARKIMEDAIKPSLFFEHVTKGKVRPFWHHKRTAEDFTTFRTPAWFSKNKEYVQELKGPINYKPSDLEASRPYFLTPDIIDKGSFKDHRVLSIDGVDLARTAWKGKTWEEKLPFIELPDRDQVYPFHDWQYGEGVLEQPGVMDAIKEQGYQIIHIKERGYDTYAVLDPSIIKPADAVLRDEAGNVIPPSQRFGKPSAAPRAQAMPDSLESVPTDQLQRQYEENQGYLGLSTLGMREGRPVRGGAAQTRELLRRNEAISAELQRRGVREEDPQLQRALQRRGQAMPDVSDGLPRRDMQSRGKTDISNDGTVTYSGKEPKDWSPQDFAGFGKDFGVRNLGPLSKVTTITDSVGRTLADIPGGIEGKFTYYDLLWLKANPVDVGALPLELHGKLTAKLARTMTPERGNDVQKFNGILFGMLSPNSPLLPNEFGQARMRFGSMDEIKKFAGLLPDNPTKEQRKSVNQRLKKELGFTSAKSGGLGIGISVDLSNIVMAAKLFVKKPDFFIKKPNESWANFVDKLTTQVSGLGTKTASFGGVWQDPLMAGISAMDRHMARAFSEELIKNPDVRGRFEGIVVKRFNDLVEKSKKTAKKEDAKIRRAKTEAAKAKAIEAKTEAMENLPDPLSLKADTLDDVLGQAEVFGADRIKNFVNEAVFAAMGSRKAKYTVKGGAINPNLPESLQGVEWVEAPKDFQVMSDAYRSALEINAQQAKKIGIEIFPSQWTLWDRIRGRVEPHEAMFPGLERLPALNDRQLGAAYAANKQAGYARNVKAGQEWKRKSGLSPSSLAYFTPAVLAAGAALSQEEQ